MLYYTSVLRRLSENFEACLHFRADPPSLPSLPIPFLHSPRNPRSFTLLCSAMYHIRAHDHIPFWCPGLEVYPGSCSVPTSEIFAVPPWAPEVAVHSAHWNRGYSLFLLLLPPQPRLMHSLWLAPLCGMGILWHKNCSPGFFLTHFNLASKLLFLAVQGSGALLSSNLEEAPYKSP